MRVLLCSPYNINPQVVQGGIAIWAQNIVDYYLTHSSGVQLEVLPYDRKERKSAATSIVKRTLRGVADYAEAIKETRKRLKKEKFDVLHICTSASISLSKDFYVLKMAKRRGLKTVVHFHFGRIPELARQNNWEWKSLKTVVKLADEAVTMDRGSYNTLLEQGFTNVHYLPNPLSQGITQQIEKEAISSVKDERKLCFVGHVIPTKGVYELVEACNGINDIRLHVLGKASPEVQEKMRRLAGDGDWLVFRGEVNHQQVIRELLTTNVFALPTYTEGFPNVILESMACGCAIATTPVGAIPEMLDIESDKPCGLCCSPKDIESLRHNIQYFLDHPDEARVYGNRAEKRVNEMYAVKKVWERLVEIWKGVMNIGVIK